MSEKLNLEIDVDTSSAIEKLRQLDELRKDAELEIEKSGKNSIQTLTKVVAVAQATTTLVTSLLNSVGIQTNRVIDFVIQSVFASISVLTPILTAETLTPAMAVQGFLGLAQLAIAGAKVAEIELQRGNNINVTKISEQNLNNLDRIVSYIGNLPF